MYPTVRLGVRRSISHIVSSAWRCAGVRLAQRVQQREGGRGGTRALGTTEGVMQESVAVAQNQGVTLSADVLATSMAELAYFPQVGPMPCNAI